MVTTLREAFCAEHIVRESMTHKQIQGLNNSWIQSEDAVSQLVKRQPCQE